MPFIDPAPILPRVPEGSALPGPGPQLAQTVGAAFDQGNAPINLFRALFAEQYPAVDGYNPLDDLKGTDYEANHLDSFIASRSQDETAAIMRRIDRETENNKILAASGGAGVLASIAAGMTDPTIALPGIVAIRAAKGGYSVGRTAAASAAAGVAQAGIQEGVLQGTQETRTAGETAMAIGSAAIISALLGSAAGTLLSRVERAALEKAVDADRAAIDAHSAGAAATDTRNLQMVRTPLDRAGLDNLSVTRRTLNAEAVEARRVMADLAETPYRFEENESGVATTQGPALDRLARMEVNGARVQIADELDRTFSEYRFGTADKFAPRLRAKLDDLTGEGGKLTFSDFKSEVSLAMQQGDRHAIPQVAQAAQHIRRRLFDPWSERAEKAVEGFERAEQAAGESYFPHDWNKELIRARRPEFTNELVAKFRAEQDTKRAIQERLRGMDDELKGLEAKIAKAKDEVSAEVLARHDALRQRIEGEIARWEGKSVQEAKAAIKAREKYAAENARAPEAKRLTAADPAIDRAVKRILASDRNLSVQELRGRASETVDRILSSPDGRLPYDMHMGGPRVGFREGPAQRGSLAGRSFNTTNAWARPWIENDIEQVVAKHLRTFVPDVLLSERFGDVEMQEAFRRINDNYSQLIDATKSEKERTRLGKERDAAIRDVAAVRDRVRGVYGWSPELANMARVANAAKAVNNMTSMGAAALSSLPDLAGVAIRNGMTSAFRDGWVPFFRNLTKSGEGWDKFKQEMRAIGIGVETAINARQHALDDVADVYKPQSRIERTLQNVSDKFFIANLLAPLTDAQKLIASHVAVSNILRATKASSAGTASQKMIANLAESGIDARMAERIWTQFQKGGEVTDGVHLPNTADWTDRAAAEALNGAVARETDIAVVTPGQEKPLWMSKPVISLLGQFKAFTASATERILVANLQRRDAAALSGLVFALGLGMMSYKLNSFFGGSKTSDRPQDWVKEGISRTGLLGWFEEGNALASKGTRGAADIYRLIGADKPLSRFQSRSAADMLLGPTWAKIESLPKITGAAASGEWTEGDTRAVRRLIPFQNLFWLRGALNQVEAGTNGLFGVEMKERP